MYEIKIQYKPKYIHSSAAHVTITYMYFPKLYKNPHVFSSYPVNKQTNTGQNIVEVTSSSSSFGPV